MAVLVGIEPQEVFQYFEEIAGIPHGSGNTGAIRDYLYAFAGEHKLGVYTDMTNNVLIKKKASQGLEGHETVILQGHMDMVCVHEPGTDIDMEREPIRLVCDGEKLTAEGTTLGGDDGIAVAMILAILASDTIEHPPIEALFTSDEEIGMVGAQAFDTGLLDGRRLINLDSEDEGIFTCGCAGGATVMGCVPLEHDQDGQGEICQIVVEGLKGGHSGTEIDQGRANAHVLLGRVLQQLAETDDTWQLIRVAGGSKDNAIPARAEAYVRGDRDTFARVAEACQGIFISEYEKADPDIRVRVDAATESDMAMTEDSKRRVIDLLCTLPNGIQKMSPDVEGLVQTSLNMGILRTVENTVCVGFSVRSSVAEEKAELINRVSQLVQDMGGRPETAGDYPGWSYRKESPLRDHMTAVFETMYGKKPVIDVIHAGLECGFFVEEIEGLDAISIGPDMTGVHTPAETLDVASVARTWAFLLEVLQGL